MIFLADSLEFPDHSIALDLMISQLDKAQASLIGGGNQEVDVLDVCEETPDPQYCTLVADLSSRTADGATAGYRVARTETNYFFITSEENLDTEDEADDGGAVVDTGDEEEENLAEDAEEESEADLSVGLKVVYTKAGEVDGTESIVRGE